MTRLNISNAVRAVACRSHNLSGRHWKAAMKIMTYVHGPSGLRLTFARSSGLELTVYSDADYTDESNDRRSVSETAVTLMGAAVRWASSTQRCSTLFRREAECAALGA